MAKKTIEAAVKLTDETKAGAEGVASSAEKVGRAFTEMDRAVMKAAKAAMKERQDAERTLMEQKIAYLRREEQMGNQRAGAMAKELQMTLRLKQERLELERIAKSEHTTLAQKMVAQQRLLQLQQQSARAIAAAGQGGGGAGGLLGLGGGMRGLVGIGVAYTAMAKMPQLVSGIDSMARQSVAFEDSMKDLLSLGGNVKNIGAVRSDVLSRSVAFGRSPQDVADFMFKTQTGTAGMAPEIVRAIEQTTLRLGQVVGGDLALIGDAVATAVRQFNLSPEVAGDRIFMAAERGKISVAELAQLAPRVLPMAREMGFSEKETFAAIATATKFSGRPEEGITALRNMLQRFQNAEAETGVKSTGTIVERLKQLEGVDPELMTKIFGGRTVATVLSLRRNIEDLTKELEKMGNSTDVVASRLADRFKDATVRVTEMAKAIEQLKNAGGILGGQALGEFQNRINLGQTQLFNNPANAGGMIAGLVVPDAIQKLISSSSPEQQGLGYAQLADHFFQQGNKPMFEAASQSARELLPNNKPGNRYRVTSDGRLEYRTADQPFLQGEDAATDARNRLNFLRGELQKKTHREDVAKADAAKAAADARAATARRVLEFAGPMTPDQMATMEKLLDDPAALGRAEAMANRGRARGATLFQQKAMEDSLRGMFDFRLGKETNAEGISMALKNLFGNFGQSNIFTGEKANYGALFPLLGEKIGEGLGKVLGRGNVGFLTGFTPRRGPAGAGGPPVFDGEVFAEADFRRAMRDQLRGNRPDGAGQVLNQFFRGFQFQGQDDKALEKKVGELVDVAKATRDFASQMALGLAAVGAF